MHKINEILRLSYEAGLSQHQIAASLHLSSVVVNKYLSMAKATNLNWPLAKDLGEAKLRQLFQTPVLSR